MLAFLQVPWQHMMVSNIWYSGCTKDIKMSAPQSTCKSNMKVLWGHKEKPQCYHSSSRNNIFLLTLPICFTFSVFQNTKCGELYFLSIDNNNGLTASSWNLCCKMLSFHFFIVSFSFCNQTGTYSLSVFYTGVTTRG